MNLTPDWIVGFVDRAASFFVHIEPHKKYRSGRRMRPEFRIVQSGSERVLLRAMQQYFGCGSIRTNRSGQLEFRIRKLTDLDRLMAFFRKHPLLSKKRYEAELCDEILQELMANPGMDRGRMTRLERKAKPLTKTTKRGIRA